MLQQVNYLFPNSDLPLRDRADTTDNVRLEGKKPCFEE